MAILSQENGKSITIEEAKKIIATGDNKGITSLQLMKIIAYVNKKNDVKNVVGYIIHLIKEGFFEPKEHIGKDNSYQESIETRQHNKEMLKEIEDLYMQNTLDFGKELYDQKN